MLQFCVYRSKRSFRDDNNLHVSISVLDEAIGWQARLEGAVLLNGKGASGC